MFFLPHLSYFILHWSLHISFLALNSCWGWERIIIIIISRITFFYRLDFCQMSTTNGSWRISAKTVFKDWNQHLRWKANETHFSLIGIMKACLLSNLRSKSHLVYFWMNELYHPMVFFASLEFKCMQRSKPPFGRKRWCNKQKLRLFTQ